MSALRVLVALCLIAVMAKGADTWPPGFAELETLAMSEPQAGVAFIQLYNLAAALGRLTELQERWADRAKQETSCAILCGWMDMWQRREADAEKWFLLVTSREPKNYYAWMGLANAQFAIESKEAMASADQAARVARTPEEALSAIWLIDTNFSAVGRIQEGREMFTKRFAQESPRNRISMAIPMTSRMVDLGKFPEWLEMLDKLAPRGWEQEALRCQTLYAMIDPALARETTSEALKRYPDQRELQLILLRAAELTGDTSIAVRIREESLGPAPTDDAVTDALIAFTKAKAEPACRRLFEKHALPLARRAARWREGIPAMHHMGVTPAARAALAPHAGIGWEVQLALAELAVAAKDFAEGERRFWDVIKSNGGLLSSRTLEDGNRRDRRVAELPLPGIKLGLRLREAESLRGRITVFNITQETNLSTWITTTLPDAKDYALACLCQLATDAGSEAKFVEQLRETTANWPESERLLAAAVAGSPAMLIESLERIAIVPPADAELEKFIPVILPRLAATSWLTPDHAKRIASVSAKFAGREKLPPIKSDPWRASLWVEQSNHFFKLFAEGKLAAAEGEFRRLITAIRRDAVSNVLVADFYLSLIQALPGIEPREKQAEAAAMILRWMAIETVCRTDWPRATDASMVLREERPPTSFRFLYRSPRVVERFIQGKCNGYFAPPRGTLPDEMRAVLSLLVRRLDAGGFLAKDYDLLRSRIAARSAELPANLARQMKLYAAIVDGWGGHFSEAVTALSDLAKEPLGETAALIATKVFAPKADADASGSRVPIIDPRQMLKLAEPKTRVGRTAFLAAQLFLSTSDERPAIIDALRKAPVSRKLISSLADAMGESFPPELHSLAKPPEGESTELPISEIRSVLSSLTAAAETEKAAELAKKTLERGDLAAIEWDTSQSAREAALMALIETGEFGAWMSALQKRAAENPDDDDAQWKLLTVAGVAAGISLEVDQDGKPRDRLTAKLIRDGQRAAFDAALLLCKRHGKDTRAWSAALQFSQEDESKIERVGNELIAKLKTDSTDIPDAAFMLQRLAHSADLRSAIRARLLKAPDLARESTDYDNLGTHLINFDMKDVLRAFWQAGAKRPSAGLSEAVTLAGYRLHLLAAQNDAAGAVDALTDLLLRYARPAPPIGALPELDRFGKYSQRLSATGFLSGAHRAGLIPDLRAAISRSDSPFKPELDMLCSAAAGDTDAPARISQRLSNAALPPPIDWLFAASQLLVTQPAAHPVVRELVGKMSSQFEKVDNDTFASCALLAARCSHPDAGKWLRASLARPPDTVEFRHAEMIAEAAGGLPDAELESEASRQHAANVRQYPIENLKRSMSEILQRGKHVVAAKVRDALVDGDGGATFSREFKRLGVNQAIAAYAGDWSELIPSVWMESKPDADGLTTLRWDLCWWRKFDNQPRELCSAGIDWSQHLAGADIDVLWGKTPERLESVAKADVSDMTFRAKLPAEKGWVAIAIKHKNRAVVGGASRLEGGEIDRLRAGQPGIPAIGWSNVAGGPLGSYVTPTWKMNSENFLPLTPSNSTFQFEAGEELRIFSWLRGGSVRLEILDSKGNKLDEQKWQHQYPAHWTRYDTTVNSSGIGGRQVEGASQMRVYIDAIGDVAGIGVSRRKVDAQAPENDSE